MCGITGWVDFRGRNAEGDLASLESMLETLRRRGPDEQRHWMDAHAALGVRRLSVVDPAGGSQPLVATNDGTTTAVLAYTGEVYNCSELRSELIGFGHTFSTRSDTEVVLKAYVQWGARCAERFNGMFAFAVWDARQQELVLIRDRAGIYPMHYHVTGDGRFLFASEPKALLAHPGVTPAIGLDGFRELCSLVRSPGNAIFDGISEVRPGWILRVDRSGISHERYWRLPVAEHEDDLETTVRTIRELLEDAVRRQLVADVPVALMLSGGLDSSVIAALASAELRRRGERLRTYGIDFTESDSSFTALEGIRSTRDAPYAAAVADHIGAVHTNVVVSPEQLMASEHRDAVLQARDVPTALVDLYTSLYVLCREVRTDSTVAITGDASDELFGGYHWAHDSRYQQSDTFAWVAAARDYPGIERFDPAALFDPDLRAALALEQFEAQSFSDAAAEVEFLPNETVNNRRARVSCHMDLTRYLQIIVDRKDRMGMAVSLEGRVPFTDHRLVEYVYNIPWELKSFDGREKSLLRAAASDLLPENVLQRQKAGYPVAQDSAYDDRLRESLRTMAADSTASIAPLLDKNRVRTYLSESSDEMVNTVNRSGIEMVLQFNEWLTQYNVDVRV